MKTELHDRRSREDLTARKMRNASWEQEEDSGPVWLWALAGLLFFIALVIS